MSMHGRPPEHYILVPGTTACLIENEYDKNIYGECNYVGNRTLIKCKQIRAIDQLGRNNGHCEIHDMFRRQLKRRSAKENFRISCENKKRRFSLYNRTQDMVCDEDLFLLPLSKTRWKETGDKVHRSSLLDDRSGAFIGSFASTKEMLKLQIHLLLKERDFLVHYRTLKQAKAVDTACKYVGLKNESTLPQPSMLDEFDKRYVRATVAYGSIICRPPHPGDVSSEFVRCCFKTQDHVCCEKRALPKTQFCLLHITHDARRVHLTKCCKCSTVAVTDERLCAFHALQKEAKPVHFIEIEVSDDEIHNGSQGLHERIVESKRASSSTTHAATSSAKKRTPSTKQWHMDGAARCRPFVSNKDHSVPEQMVSMSSQTIAKCAPTGFHIPKAATNRAQVHLQYSSPLQPPTGPVDISTAAVRRPSRPVLQTDIVRQSNSDHAAQRRRQIEEDQKAAATIQEDNDYPNTSFGDMEGGRPFFNIQTKQCYTTTPLHQRREDSQTISHTHRPVAGASNVVYNAPLTATQASRSSYTLRTNVPNATYVATTVPSLHRLQAGGSSNNGGYVSTNSVNLAKTNDGSTDSSVMNSALMNPPSGTISRVMIPPSRNISRVTIPHSGNISRAPIQMIQARHEMPNYAVKAGRPPTNTVNTRSGVVVNSAVRRCSVAGESMQQRGHVVRVPNIAQSSIQQAVYKNGIHPVRRSTYVGNDSQPARVLPAHQVRAQYQRARSTTMPVKATRTSLPQRNIMVHRILTDRADPSVNEQGSTDNGALQTVSSERVPPVDETIHNINQRNLYQVEQTSFKAKMEDVRNKDISAARSSLTVATSFDQPPSIGQDPLTMLAEQALRGPSGNTVDSVPTQDFELELSE